jgi:outer membrane protein OmpA-like peptidoglycan-associated protein
VASVLISSGVAASRVRATGMGENQPVATNQTPEGRALNRRVEIIITPIQ